MDDPEGPSKAFEFSGDPGAETWRPMGNREAQAYVSYSSIKLPGTGRPGWVWWALGTMGYAETLEEAQAKAEAELKKARGK